jgi:hypothetical protein
MRLRKKPVFPCPADISISASKENEIAGAALYNCAAVMRSGLFLKTDTPVFVKTGSNND